MVSKLELDKRGWLAKRVHACGDSFNRGLEEEGSMAAHSQALVLIHRNMSKLERAKRGLLAKHVHECNDSSNPGR